MSFNREQLNAINTKINENVLISAGAGSGKTATLTEKVKHLILKDRIKPSELLVLTFTNNAAHQMKERIIGAFKDDAALANQLESAHIQTFDSFAMELAKAYSLHLGIPESISVANEDVVNAKKRSLIDEIFLRWFNDKSRANRLITFLSKYNLRDDKISKAVILDVADQLDKMIPEKRNLFIKLAKEDIFTLDSFKAIFHDYVAYYRNQIIQTIYYAYFLEKNFIAYHEKNINQLAEAFKSKTLFNQDYHLFHFVDIEINEQQYQTLLSLLALDDENFIKQLKAIRSGKMPNVFPISASSFKKHFKDDLRGYEIAKEFNKIVIGKSALLAKLVDIADSFDDEYTKFISTKEDVALIFELVNELNESLLAYKSVSNCYTYSDIANFALKIMTDDAFKQDAEAVRSRYKYIMIDEYQDTNDLQEAVINSLMLENAHGYKSHLFAVGDAKQSIYAFRNSNLALFNARKDLYLNEPNGNQVIFMNKNYRSRQEVLDAINYIFSYYMNDHHGGIVYNNHEQMLEYGDTTYTSKNPQFGVIRYCSINAEKGAANHQDWERKMIIQDIKNKIESHFQVYDRDLKKMRDCTYSDFVILMRVKTGFMEYQKAFVEAGIPLNNVTATNLNEIDAIIVLESLISLIATELIDKTYLVPIDRDHVFTSVARSYLYQYSDQKIYDLLTKHQVDHDPLMEDVHRFVREECHHPFHQIFINLITHFHVIDKLYLIGNADDNIAKIEALYQIVLSEENAGEGIEEFIKLFKDISKYRIDLTSESTTNITDAVDMMTIHASKGLENKIVYLPYSYNHLGGDNRAKDKDYIFSKKYGILLPYYRFTMDQTIPFDTLPRLLVALSSKSEDIDEHVRLYYVALTRAENLVCIVGNPIGDEQREKDRETLYGMFYYLPHYEKLNEQFVLDKINRGIIHQIDYDAYQLCINHLKEVRKLFTLNDFSNDQIKYDAYSLIWDRCYYQIITDLCKEKIKAMKLDLAKDYYGKFVAKHDDDMLARLFTDYYHRYFPFCDYANLLALAKTGKYGYFENVTPDDSVYVSIDENNLKDVLSRFADAVIKQDFVYFLAKEDSDKKHDEYLRKFLLKMLPSFMRAYDNVLSFSYETFENSTFPDCHELVELTNNNVNREAPSLEEFSSHRLDDSNIDFPIREHHRASIKSINDEDLPDAKTLERGTYLHTLMELVDLKSKDTSFIENANDRAIIDKVLTNEIFDLLKGADVYKEYVYYDELEGTTGFIDLFFVKGGEYYIVDYKSKHTENDGYLRQLHAYQRNIENIHHVASKHIHLYLLSLIDDKLIEVENE